jgi:hypothetical protein
LKIVHKTPTNITVNIVDKHFHFYQTLKSETDRRRKIQQDSHEEANLAPDLLAILHFLSQFFSFEMFSNLHTSTTPVLQNRQLRTNMMSPLSTQPMMQPPMGQPPIMQQQSLQQTMSQFNCYVPNNSFNIPPPPAMFPAAIQPRHIGESALTPCSIGRCTVCVAPSSSCKNLPGLPPPMHSNETHAVPHIILSARKSGVKKLTSPVGSVSRPLSRSVSASMPARSSPSIAASSPRSPDVCSVETVRQFEIDGSCLVSFASNSEGFSGVNASKGATIACGMGQQMQQFPAKSHLVVGVSSYVSGTHYWECQVLPETAEGTLLQFGVVQRGALSAPLYLQRSLRDNNGIYFSCRVGKQTGIAPGHPEDVVISINPGDKVGLLLSFDRPVNSAIAKSSNNPGSPVLAASIGNPTPQLSILVNGQFCGVPSHFLPASVPACVPLVPALSATGPVGIYVPWHPACPDFAEFDKAEANYYARFATLAPFTRAVMVASAHNGKTVEVSSAQASDIKLDCGDALLFVEEVPLTASSPFAPPYAWAFDVGSKGIDGTSQSSAVIARDVFYSHQEFDAGGVDHAGTFKGSLKVAYKFVALRPGQAKLSFQLVSKPSSNGSASASRIMAGPGGSFNVFVTK